MSTALPPAGDPNVLYLVDLSSYLLRAYHAVAPLTSPSGEPTHATYGTVNMLERLVRERRPALLAVALDSGRDTFRRELYPEYKAHRPPAPDDLRVQMARAEEIVEAFGIPTFKQSGVEADDLIATVVERARARGVSVVIVGADKDLMQLVGPDVVLWDTMRDRVFGVPEVEERYGVSVDKLRDLLALMGDSSDNIPGVPHVGPKTARDLLNAHGTLEALYANLERIERKKLRENLAEHEPQARVSQKLVTLKSDCPIEFDLEQLRFGGRDVPRLARLYSELGFTRQLHALGEQGERPQPPTASEAAAPAATAPIPLAYEVVRDSGALERLAARARTAELLSIYVETVDPTRPWEGLVGIALADAPGRAAYVPLGHRLLDGGSSLPLSEVRERLGPVLGDPRVPKAAHGIRRVMVALDWHDLPLAGAARDTELMHYLLDPEARHALEPLADAGLGMKLDARETLTHPARGRHVALDEVPVDDVAPHASSHADASLRLAAAYQPKLLDLGLGDLYRDLELPLCALLARMERRGVLVDVERLREIGVRCERELAELERRAHEAAGKEFNVNSPRQLEALLFDELGLKPLKRTKTHRSTDAATLDALSEEHPLPQIILELRQIAKLKGTYIDALPSLVNPKTGRIHTSWEQAVAATGRLSSVDPNLQNIPVRSELGREIRAAFVAPPGHYLLSADYSQIELRVLAHLSQDPVLLDAFRAGQDIHTRTAMEIFGLTPDAVTSEHRRRAKAVNFGVIYGQGDSGLAKSLGISRKEAADFIGAYFARYQGVREFMDSTLQSARSSDAVRTLLGRRRLVPDIRHGNRARRLAAERVAMNAPIQGTAADILKLAMLRFAEPVTPGSHLVLTVHDELVFEVPEAELSSATERVRSAMQGAFALAVPLVVDVGHARNWKDAH
ncbi:MAG: DNA polymerase I [Polyangiaceae bacterium]|nr:DNA polymerase I [Polyangiaceae bacterium]